ncbi:nitrilase [Marivirga tractuosa]|uniref:Nitrilase/cyanide hydratase and apolipoprotein N-acyltransferase n=1 Tax=Marivirga tractuosa (strain ATCC 23168 / DSM 4126 / NBRC 15989 / NCIMB 1408 / VKM B-1430 / H-43) TaxID=643867 RepID=E4TM75_MARTH|nr:carbon-nitrogen hydrolase family protein [Marivirga tractuosa]ADR21351.1 Nitrilase/cyanide hydratase and apolipoprotein N-acyltransferase [Marivirga tractuosa DSM 4126]BDD14195.1 nitrilase [Marivirga tractuosa]
MKKFKVGCVQATPSLFNKSKTMDIVLKWIKKGFEQGVKLLVFPESFIPAYPAGLAFGTVVGSRTEPGREQFREYWDNSVEVGAEETQQIAKWAQEYEMYITIGVTERDSVSKTLYCTLLYFSPHGKLMGRHRKLKPTAAERLVWGEGDGTTLSTFNTEIGKLGGLICWENYMPLARMSMYQKGVEIYVAPTADSRDSWNSSLIHIACEGRCYVVGSNQFIRKRDYPEHLQKELATDRPEILSRGGSVIISPLGKVLAGPLYHEEGLLTAEIDHDEIIRAKMDFDVIGHYARNDVFGFEVNGQPDMEKEE